jgi:hypothetical protein
MGARHRRASLEVQERRVPGIADLAGEKRQPVNLRSLHNQRSKQAVARAAQIRPIALSFPTKDPVAHLPAIAKLSTDHTAGRVAASVNEEDSGRDLIPADVGLTPARRASTL